jgi:hypothetical protein
MKVFLAALILSSNVVAHALEPVADQKFPASGELASRRDAGSQVSKAGSFKLSRADYEDRVNAIWHAQLIAVLLTLPFEHHVAAVEPVRAFPKNYTSAFVDDDWYYEMCALRAFEKHGVGLTVDQLGEQWLENACGSYGSSMVARENLLRGLPGREAGHPRHNRLWWTIGPVFSADLYGAVAPGMPNEAGRLARELCALNGHGEALDGAVLYAGAISLGFAENDVREVLRKSVLLIDPSSPYRQCVESVMQMAEQGRSFEEIAAAVEDRWRVQYPASNNAVPNGGLTAACLWFGKGDFWATIDLACRAADFSDTDNSAATAVSVIAAMKGMKALPADLVAQLNYRIVGEKLGRVKVTPPVDEKISALARRTAAIGEKIVVSRGGRVGEDEILVVRQSIVTQAAQRFRLADLTRWWNPDWTLERAGFGGDGIGAMPGIRGYTALNGDTLITYPRDEARGLVLRRNVKLGDKPSLELQVAADPGKAWELSVYAGNRRILEKVIVGNGADFSFETLNIDLSALAGKDTTLRLYQRVLLPGKLKLPSKAHWKSPVVR